MRFNRYSYFFPLPKHIISDAHAKFWSRNPALLYAIAMFLGFQTHFHWHVALLIPISLLFLSVIWPGLVRRAFLAVAMFAVSLLLAKATTTIPDSHLLPESSKGIPGRARVTISSLSLRRSHFGQAWHQKGRLISFIPTGEDKSVASGIPYTLRLPSGRKIHRPPANRQYLIEGKLRQSRPGSYVLIPDKDKPWYPVVGTWSFAEWRLRSKKWVSDWIESHVSDRTSGHFLSGIATGDFSDRLLSSTLGRFGLQHIMAVSGFHFAIIAAVFSVMLQLLFPRRVAATVLILLLSSYFLFLGSGPGIMRAWLMALITLVAYLLKRPPSALNSLGVAMMVVLLIDPYYCRHLGFQFSFLATGAILLLYPAVDLVIQLLLPKRRLYEAIALTTFSQHGYVILAWFRGALALTLSVHLVVVPLLLLYFHKFPWLSLIYNLFFPFLVSIAILLLLLTMITSVVMPPFVPLLFKVLTAYTSGILAIVLNMPTTLDFSWYRHSVPVVGIAFYLVGLFGVGIVARYMIEQKREEMEDFAFI